MRYENEETPKGLFTFYKEQEEQEQSEKLVKKHKKSKSKKSKKKIPDRIPEQISLPSNNSTLELVESKQLNLREHFLKNIIGKQSKLENLAHANSANSVRLRTQPYQSPRKEPEVANFICKANEASEHYLIRKLRSKQKQKREFEFQKYLQRANTKITLLQGKIAEADMFKSPRAYEGIHVAKAEIKKMDESEVIARSCKNENKSFLEKLRFLQRKSKSNLISNRDSARDSVKGPELHGQNQKYFQQLISNFYKHPSNENNSAYKILKKSLKFPNIVQAKVVRIKTEQGLPIRCSQKIMTPLRSCSSYKKDLHSKNKRSNQRYTELFKLNVINELKQSIEHKDPKALNFIDMSKDYSISLVESDDRKMKKKMVKSRLGVQL